MSEAQVTPPTQATEVEAQPVVPELGVRKLTAVAELLEQADWMVEHFLDGEQLAQANEFGFYSEVNGRDQWQWYQDNWDFDNPVDPDELIKAKALDAKRRFMTGDAKNQVTVLAQSLEAYGIEAKPGATERFNKIFYNHPDMKKAVSACRLLGLGFRSIWQGSGTDTVTIVLRPYVAKKAGGGGSAPKSGLSGKMAAWLKAETG